MSKPRIVVLMALFVSWNVRLACAAPPDAVMTSIQKAKQALYAMQANGNWEVVAAPDPKKWGNDTAGPQFSGLTAFAAYALVCAGDSATEPHVASAIDFLKKTPTPGIYALSARCLLWSSITLDPPTRAVASKDFKQLVQAMRTKVPARGMFYYTAPLNANDVMYDHSVSQFAVLAVWAMEQRGFEAPGNFWKMADQAWRDHQNSEGGWPYMVVDKDPQTMKVTPTMTAAGVATLMITSQSLRTAVGCDPSPTDPNVAKGIDWLGKRFDLIFDHNAEAFGGGFQNYTLFGVSRIGTASGLAYLGEQDWYGRGTDFLVKTQQPDGSWHGGWLLAPASCTSFGLLFMSYGSAPVIVNKLRYHTESANGKPEEAWNLRPRDMFNLSRWISVDSERRVNWQVVELTGRSSELLFEAPVLLIGGNKAPRFSDQETAVLKNYLSRGGLIVGNADCASEEFNKGFADLAHSLVPDYEFRILPDDHPIYTHQIYPVQKFKKKIRLKGLSNGVRELMLIADTDLSKPLNLNDVNSARESFETWSNIIQYATDQSGLRQKGVVHLVTLDPQIETVKTIHVARIQYAGNWNPEPGGWEQFRADMHNQRKFDVTTETVDLGKGGLEKYKIAHLTGTNKLALSDVQRAELKSFVDGGGTLIIDAAGGESEFAISAESELETIFGPTVATQLRDPAPTTNQIYASMAQPSVSVKYRRFGREKMAQDRHQPDLRLIEKDGHLGVIYSREDLSAGLVGQRVDGITGYEPESASALMRSILECVSAK